MSDTSAAKQGVLIWVVGLPGSGKSTYAHKITAALEQTREVVLLQMDVKRKAYFPNPSYTAEEREKAYAMLAEEGAALANQGRCVILDGTAYKVSMREYARSLVPQFIEVFIRCSLDVAMQREADRPEGLVMAGLYEKALERKKTGKQFDNLGQVIGIDIPFEENPHAECVLDSDKKTLEEGFAQITACLANHDVL